MKVIKYLSRVCELLTIYFECEISKHNFVAKIFGINKKRVPQRVVFHLTCLIFDMYFAHMIFHHFHASQHAPNPQRFIVSFNLRDVSPRSKCFKQFKCDFLGWGSQVKIRLHLSILLKFYTTSRVLAFTQFISSKKVFFPLPENI